MAQIAETFRALVLESDPLVTERLRHMLRAEDFHSCVVDDIDLFHRIRTCLSFDLFVVGVARGEALRGLRLEPDLRPLVLVAPVETRGDLAPYRLSLPHARVVDRRLRDPDAVRRVIADPEAAHLPPDGGGDAVRRAFDGFDLSERQLQVLSRALVGDTRKEIAKALFISEPTVSNHLHAIYERVGVSGRRQLMGRFVQGLIE